MITINNIITLQVEPKELSSVIDIMFKKGFDLQSCERHYKPKPQFREETFAYRVSFVKFTEENGETDE